MAKPTPSSPLNNPSHSALHNLHVNVKMFGATGDGVTDDTTAIQAAYDALGSSGTIFFPQGNYKITSAISIGSASAFVHHVVGGVGPTPHGAPAAARITQATANADIFTVTQTVGQGNSLLIEKMQLVYTTVGTGIAIHTDPANWVTGLTIRECFIQKAGTGIKLNQQVTPLISDVGLDSCTVGVDLSDAVNMVSFENCVFHGNGNALMIGFVQDLRMVLCTFEASSGPDIMIPAAGGAIRGGQWDSCWWEGSASNFIRVDGNSAGSAGHAWNFSNCNFANPHHLIESTVGTGTNAKVTGMTFSGCVFTLSGNNILKTAQDMSASGDPGWYSVSFINCTGTGPIKGMPPRYLGTGTGAHFIGNASGGPTSSSLVTSSIDGLVPKYFETLATSTDTNGSFLITNNFIEANEIADPAAPGTNRGRLYIKDNGAGKTQLVVRFNTGAVQVLATEP